MRARAFEEHAVFDPGPSRPSHSGPYMHDGQLDSIEDVIDFYRSASHLGRIGELRNGAPEIAGIALVHSDVRALVAFLHSLNEDYN
jgi:cytochrome c peroxidase